jgi:hypothetical protein
MEDFEEEYTEDQQNGSNHTDKMQTEENKKELIDIPDLYVHSF